MKTLAKLALLGLAFYGLGILFLNAISFAHSLS